MIKAIIKSFFSYLPLMALSKGHRFVLCYHDISEPSSEHHSPLYSTPIDTFKSHISFLKKHFEIISLNEILGPGLDYKKNYLSITFDDGFKSVHDIAWPILKANKIPTTIFVNKSAIEQDQLWVSNIVSNEKDSIKKINALLSPESINIEDTNYFLKLLDNFKEAFLELPSAFKERIYMNSSEIKSLQKDKVTIENHSLNHCVLSQINQDSLQKEIDNNHQYIKDTFNLSSKHFAIPFGKKEHYNETVLKSIYKEHKHVYTTNPNKLDSSDQLIPRIVLTNESLKDLQFYFNRALLKRTHL